jgi:hypothetical protein
MLVSLNLILYAVFLDLLIKQFNKFSTLSKFIGQPLPASRKRRRRWLKVFKVKVPYFYRNSANQKSLPCTYSTIKLYKLFWKNTDLFQVSTMGFIKRYAVFGKKSRMLKNILKRVIKKSKKTNHLKRYKYTNFKTNYTFKKNYNINTISGMFSGIVNSLSKVRKIRKRRAKKTIKPVMFKKFFFKTVIESRQLVKLLLKKKQKRKGSFSKIISASAHTTFFNRLNKLELSLFNLVLRSKFTTSIKDAFT